MTNSASSGRVDHFDPRYLARKERSQKAVAAATELARAYGLRVTEPRILADLFSVMVHLRPAPVVARVSTWLPLMRSPIEDWLVRELTVASWLAEQNAPVVAPSRELPPGPHQRDGFTMSFWTYLRADPDREVSTADCVAMLADLHAVLRHYPGRLPLLPMVANDIPIGLAALDCSPEPLSAAEADQLRETVERLRPFWETLRGEPQPVHGDAHPGNVMATPDGLVWIDFEDVCLAPREWDLSLLHWMDAETVVTQHRPDPELLRRCSELRAVHLALSMIRYREVFGDLPDWDWNIRYLLTSNALGRI